jgi:hypothetical protein
MATRKPRTPPAPVVLTPEQLEAQAAREARNAAYLAARAALLDRAHALAEKLAPGRVTRNPAYEDFSVMFGDHVDPHSMLAGPGLIGLQVGLSSWERQPDSDDFAPPTLRFAPRSFSISSGADLTRCAALGQALIEAANLGRTILALVG